MRDQRSGSGDPVRPDFYGGMISGPDSVAGRIVLDGSISRLASPLMQDWLAGKSAVSGLAVEEIRRTAQAAGAQIGP